MCNTYPRCFFWEVAYKHSDVIGKEFKLKYLKLMSSQESMLLLQLIWVLKILMQLYSIFRDKTPDNASVKNRTESSVCPCVAGTASVKHGNRYSALSSYSKNHLLVGQTLQPWWVFLITICIPQLPCHLPGVLTVLLLYFTWERGGRR